MGSKWKALALLPLLPVSLVILGLYGTVMAANRGVRRAVDWINEEEDLF